MDLGEAEKLLTNHDLGKDVQNPEQPVEAKIKYIQVSDLLIMAHEIGLGNEFLIELLFELAPYANIQYSCQELARLDLLNVVYDVGLYLSEGDDAAKKKGLLFKLITEGFKAAVQAKRFFSALRFVHDFDYILERNILEVSNALIESLKEDPFYAEIKISMLAKFVSLMSFDTISNLLDAAV